MGGLPAFSHRWFYNGEERERGEGGVVGPWCRGRDEEGGWELLDNFHSTNFILLWLFNVQNGDKFKSKFEARKENGKMGKIAIPS